MNTLVAGAGTGVPNTIFGIVDLATTIIAAGVPKVTFGMLDLATTTIVAAATP
jgi:hypothetical protein